MFYIESNKLYEVSAVITDIGHNIFTTAVMANKDFYDGLSDADQALVQQAIAEATDYILDYQQGLEAESMAKIQAAKPEVRFVSLPEDQRVAFREASAAVKAKFVEMTGDSGQAILAQMEADLQDAKGK